MLGNLLMRPMHCGFSLFTIQSLLNSLHFGFPLNCITLTLKRIISAIILKSVKKNKNFFMKVKVGFCRTSMHRCKRPPKQVR